MPKPRVPQHVIRRLREIRETATMERARFELFSEAVMLASHIPGKTVHVGTATEFIRERTLVWRNSWIISPLDELIRWAEGEGKDLNRR